MKDVLSTRYHEMTDQIDDRLEAFILALKRLHVTQLQLSNLRKMSKTEIANDRHKDAEYSISLSAQLEKDLPRFQEELTEAFKELSPELKTELSKVICGKNFKFDRLH
ncbi:hypothetical protein [Roseibium sp.]|uniref:hypothetical protein n=1 Tax=Roseibium sp. TaxID=1936156 RepID=UPI003B515533